MRIKLEQNNDNLLSLEITSAIIAGLAGSEALKQKEPNNDDLLLLEKIRSSMIDRARSEALKQKEPSELQQFWANVHQLKKGLARFEALAEEGVKLTTFLPEDLQAILEDMQKRWIQKQYSPQKIRYLTLLYLFDMILGYVKSQIANIWLPKSVSTKEIE
jgi:hypothetical protein